MRCSSRYLFREDGSMKNDHIQTTIYLEPEVDTFLRQETLREQKRTGGWVSRTRMINLIVKRYRDAALHPWEWEIAKSEDV